MYFIVRTILFVFNVISHIQYYIDIDIICVIQTVCIFPHTQNKNKITTTTKKIKKNLYFVFFFSIAIVFFFYFISYF